MRILLKTAFFLFCVCSINVYNSHCYAQRYPLRIYSVKEGLPQSQVQMILQDSSGYLWIGTADGLACFDGKSFDIYTKKDGLFSNYIQNGLLDAKGNIWISHRACGLSKINTKTKVIESVTLPANLRSVQINDIHQDVAGNLWFATAGEGAFQLTGEHWRQLKAKDGLTSNFISSICHTPDGALWLATDKGVSIYRTVQGNKGDLTALSKQDGLPADRVTSIMADSLGDIWLGTDDHGIVRIFMRRRPLQDWQFKKYTISDGLSSNQIRALYEDLAGKIWIATANNGITIYTPPSMLTKGRQMFDVLTNRHGLSYREVTSVFQDREGSYWIGTNGGGLCQFWDKRFEFYGDEEGFVNDAIWAIREDSKGNIWFGSEKGLTRYIPKEDKSGYLDIKNYTRKDGLLGDEVDAIYQDPKGRLWLGVYGAGVQIFNPLTEKFSKSTIINDKQILCIVPDKRDNLWFGSNGGGIYCYNLNTHKVTNFNTSNGLPSNDVFSLLFSAEDVLWMATRDGGIASYDGSSFRLYTAEDGFYSKSALSLTKDLDGNIWISTAGDGIFKYDGRTFTNYFVKDGLSGDDAYFLTCDHSNNIWLGTRRGVEKFNPASGVIKLYDRYEGFKAIETNQNAVYKDSKAMLWFGTIDGAIKYNPEEDRINSVPPLIYIEDPVLLLRQTSVPENDRIPYKNNHLSFHYSALSFVCPEKIVYKYKLEGLDTGWYEETNVNYARYANLAPGIYTFKVKARNNDGVWSEQAAVYSFEILTPFYRSIWFFSGLVLFLGLAIYGAHWRHVANIQKTNVRLEDKIKVRTRQLVAEKEKVQQAYESLCESEERYRQLIELSPDAIVVHIDGIIEYVNKAGVILFAARNPEDLIGKSLFDLAHPDYIDIARERIRQIYEEKKRVGLMRQQMSRLDGSTVDVEVLGSPISYMGKNAGQAVVRDITDRKRMEMELLKSQKLESIGLLAGGIAHDFNNILTAILGNVSMAKMYSSQTEINSNLSKAETAAVQAKELTQQLLTFSKGGAPIKETASIYEIVNESASFILSGSEIQCEFDSPPDLWAVDVDPGQISQVIQNLVINAQQAMPQGKKIKVTLKNLTLANEVFPSLKAGRYVKISIQDEGIGIPEKHLARIFDPYFTTKKKGSGLGLTTTYSIVRRHDGHILVSSTSGIGTVVDVYLPASNKILEKKNKREAFMRNGKGRILVMDDEDMVLELIGQVLEHLGYTVQGVKDGESAIREYKRALSEKKPYDVIIMDLTIPGGIGGKEAIESLKTIDPNVKAVVSSGYSNDPIMANYKKFGFVARLGKPYQIETLSATILELMNNHS